ncbi:MAG: hypothetical protein Q7T53_07460 [Deltaproteobacteria bacterium]|nr:hypothetical protein [Deltaproteobacteria bacterium]
MKTNEDKFTSELEIYCTEVEAAIKFFYSFLAVNASLADNKRALDLVNEAPLFWRTIIGALKTSFFITLGRVFDQQSNHNVDRLLKVAHESLEIFSTEALERRKRAGSTNADEWIDDYMRTAYVPTPDDFRRLRGYVRKYRKVYETGYRDIRHKIYAHKQLSKAEDVQALYAKTNIREMQKMLIFLNRLYTSLWELFHNGRKPVLRPMKYSVASMRKSETPQWQSKQVQEQVVHETEIFFKLLATVPNDLVDRTRKKRRSP